eukprot:TRINITY_DN5980_c0_g1_i2.p1 TRINITY_DN5980_c0_g1~~TRINITY_DN5980_c0_g1_i2.p1  ORF type:complete len:501 (-),score=147.62 TRINITY_DN5980_c0_g1_i2:43-1545(-)
MKITKLYRKYFKNTTKYNNFFNKHSYSQTIESTAANIVNETPPAKVKNHKWIGWTIGGAVFGGFFGYIGYIFYKNKKGEEYDDLIFTTKVEKKWDEGYELATQSLDRWILREKKKSIVKDRAFFLLKQGRYQESLEESDKILNLSVGFASEDKVLDGTALLIKARIYKIMGEDDISKKILEKYFLTVEPNHPGYIEATKLEASFENNFRTHMEMMISRGRMVVGYNPKASLDAYAVIYGPLVLTGNRSALRTLKDALMNAPFVGEDEYVCMLDLCFVNSFFGNLDIAIERAKDIYTYPNASTSYSSFLPNISIAKLVHMWNVKKDSIKRLKINGGDIVSIENLLEISLLEHNFGICKQLCDAVDNIPEQKKSPRLIEMHKLTKSFLSSWIGEKGDAVEGNLFRIREPIDHVPIFIDYVQGNDKFVLSSCEKEIENFLRMSRDERDMTDLRSIFILYGLVLEDLGRSQEALSFWQKAISEYITNDRHKNKIVNILNQHKTN